MSVLRRKMFSGEQNLGYAKNGLVLHLDGIRNTRGGHNPNSSVWEDLSGNQNDLDMYGNVPFIEPYADFSENQENQENYFQGTFSCLDGHSYTFEFCADFCGRLGTLYGYHPNVRIYSIYHNAQTQMKYASKTDPIAAKYAIATVQHDANIPGTFSNRLDIKKQTLSAFINGLMPDSGEVSLDNTAFGPAFRVGANVLNQTPNTTFSAFSGRMYSVRVYDRVLTDEEIAYNYEIDKRRFNL